MPVYLPPISRRRFLQTVVAAGTTVAARPLWAEDKPADPHRLALFSDTHLWSDRHGRRNGASPDENFTVVCDQVLACAQRPARALISGDCAHLEGLPADYAAIAELVQPLREAGMGLHLALGNHDHRKNIMAAFPDPLSPPPVVDKRVSVVETPRANWFLLDSLERTNVTPGRLGEPQLAWLAKELDARPDKPALVMAHHHPEVGIKTSGLADTDALLNVLVPRKQVKAYFFGHTHAWKLYRHDGLHLVNLPTTAWVFNPKEPQAWVEAELQERGIALTLHALDPKHAAHGKTTELAWR